MRLDGSERLLVIGLGSQSLNDYLMRCTRAFHLSVGIGSSSFIAHLPQSIPVFFPLFVHNFVAIIMDDSIESTEILQSSQLIVSELKVNS